MSRHRNAIVSIKDRRKKEPIFADIEKVLGAPTWVGEISRWRKLLFNHLFSLLAATAYNIMGTIKLDFGQDEHNRKRGVLKKNDP